MAISIQELKNTPIDLSLYFLENYKDFYNIKLNQGHPLAKEEILDASVYGLSYLNFYHADYNPPYYHSIPGSIPQIYLRKTVLEKLKTINELLAPYSLELFLLDGQRPIAVQNYFYREWVPQKLRLRFPDKDEQWIANETSKYWAKGANSFEELISKIPPHSTGAAVDLTIRNKKTHQWIEMGGVFDDTSSISSPMYYEKIKIDSFTKEIAQENRRILHHIMTREGFAPHPNEWWHFSYGDQAWSYAYSKEQAFYHYAGDQKNLDF